jgi:hypothetical protein
MNTPDVIPHIKGFWNPKRSGTVAKITKGTNSIVEGDIIHNDGMPIPFSVVHNHRYFVVGDQYFYFKNWNFKD